MSVKRFATATYWMRRALAAENEAASERGIRRHVQAEFLRLDRLYGDALLERDYLRAKLEEGVVDDTAALTLAA